MVYVPKIETFLRLSSKQILFNEMRLAPIERGINNR